MAALEPHLGEWQWDGTWLASGYRIYTARPGEPWQMYVDVPAQPPFCIEDAQDPTKEHCGWILDENTLPYGLVFVLITAFNDYGESPTEHGAWAGEGYFPEA